MPNWSIDKLLGVSMTVSSEKHVNGSDHPVINNCIGKTL